MHTKTMALVLKNANYRDYDRMLTLFSGDMGRVDVLARGCRKQNSPLLPLSSVFACGEFYLAQKGDRYYLEQGVLKDSFFELRGKMSALTVAMTMTEVAERVVMPEQPNKRLFALMVNALFYLAREGIPEDIFVFFVFKLLDILGLRPLTDRCIACGAEKIVAADKDGGGGLCAECSSEEEKAAFADLQKVLATPSTGILSFHAEEKESSFEIACNWLTDALEYEPKSLVILKTVIK